MEVARQISRLSSHSPLLRNLCQPREWQDSIQHNPRIRFRRQLGLSNPSLRRQRIRIVRLRVRWYAKCILLGLSHIHKQGYVHCDIKPHNILLVGGSGSLTSLRPRRKRVEEETLQIADFGSAKKAGKKGKGGWRGTPLYAAPESVLFQEYEPHSDVWAFGCTVLEMITGEPAWRFEPEADTCAVLYQIGFTRRVPEIPSWVTEEAKDFLRKCLVRDPEWRWTADMLLRHPFVSAKVMMLPSMESKRRESCSLPTKQKG